jgi:hypothetical protein
MGQKMWCGGRGLDEAQIPLTDSLVSAIKVSNRRRET